MDISTEQLIQLSLALLLAVGLFVAAWSAPMRISIAVLLVLMPIQLVETKYGSSSVAMTYVLLVGLLLSGRQLQIPMLGHLLLVLFAYLLSMSQVHASLYGQHGVYVFLLVSGFVVFVLAYNLARDVKDARFVVNVLIAMNILVVVYCLIQLAAGPGAKTMLLETSEFTMHRNRGGGDPRLSGPFGGSPGITAEYLALMILVLAYDLMHPERRRKFGVLMLIAVNLGLMIATANRGAFLTLVASFPLFLFLYRRELGTARVLQFSISGAAILAIMGAITVAYTDFGQLFDRLESTTEFEGGIPQTRSKVWPTAWEHFQEKPWLGHGPRLRLLDDETQRYPGHVAIPYPHSLYLFLLCTVGIIGTAAFLFLIVGAALRVFRGRHRQFESAYVSGLVRLGPLLIFAFLVSQIRIEFLREHFVDYQHFVFALLGTWLGLADRGDVRAGPNATTEVYRGIAANRTGV